VRSRGTHGGWRKRSSALARLRFYRALSGLNAGDDSARNTTLPKRQAGVIMFKRFTPAATAIAFAALAIPAGVEAGPYYGYDGRHYGELANAPNWGRPEHALIRGGGDRKGLTPAALALLDRIETEFGPVDVISGYRPGARIATSGRISRHASGNAIDFDAGSRKGAIVKWLIAHHKTGGTMTYSDMSHIHVDIGPHFVSLGANSGRTGRSASRGSGRYGARYDRDDRNYDRYDRVSDRGYARERSYGTRYGYASDRPSYGGARSSFASGYATIYN
jgi:hypothetical protein